MSLRSIWQRKVEALTSIQHARINGQHGRKWRVCEQTSWDKHEHANKRLHVARSIKRRGDVVTCSACNARLEAALRERMTK